MLKQQIKVINKLGLHLRAATKLVQVAAEFDASISISCNNQTADAKSIMDVLMLAAIMGTTLTVTITGKTKEEEVDAMKKITTLINNRFDENE